MSDKIHSGHIEVAVSHLIGFRRNVIVPNVSWGLGFRHECDMLVLDSAGRFTEIEIKISVSDLKKDFEKPHGHFNPVITRLVYAVPEKMVELTLGSVGANCGVIAVTKNERTGRFVARWVRQCRHRNPGSKPDEKTVKKFMELGCMRIWSLKSRLYKTATK